LTIEYLTGNTYYKYLQASQRLVFVCRPEGKQRKKNDIEYFVFEIDFMVKLLRACVWMPWRKEAMKDVVSCDKPREDANSL
jgi:hypothetical protein